MVPALFFAGGALLGFGAAEGLAPVFGVFFAAEALAVLFTAETLVAGGLLIARHRSEGEAAEKDESGRCAGAVEG